MAAAVLPQASFAAVNTILPKPVFTRAKPPAGNIVSDSKPTLLTADRIDYDQENDVVVASGKVEVAQGDTLLLADTLTYDRTKDIVTARGHVSVMDETGSVTFADEVELRDQMSSGVAEQFKARLNDDSLFAAKRAVRVNENVTELDDAVYSPCKVKCAEPGEREYDPLWQLRADHVKIDEEKQTVTYTNAEMQLYGLPVFYTPYLSHATPGADGKSGLGAPEFQRNDNLGSVYKVPFYYAIAPDKDVTITAEQTSQEGPVMFADYRQKFDNGKMTFDGSITDPQDRDPQGNPIPGRRMRGHVFTKGDFSEGEDTSWGFDIQRTTDDTYMRKYDIDDNTVLNSRVYGETHNFMSVSDRNSLSMDALAFQGLTTLDDAQKIPLILPLVNFGFESDPMSNGGRYFANSNAMVLSRDIGAESRRLSNTVGWRLPYITGDGQIIEFKTQLRSDIYDVSDVALSNGSLYSGTTGRVIPEASALWRYPFIDQMESGSIMIEPVVNMAVSSSGGNPERLPNEDSLVPEFTDTNLFSDDRYPGYDRVEHGPRVSYGMRGLVNYEQAYIDGLFGQYYRMQEDRNLPISNDITDTLSDYVGKVGIQYQPFYLAYRFRLDRDTLAAHRKEVDLSYTGKRFTMSAAYLSLQNDPVFATREEISGLATVNLNKNWSTGFTAREDLQLRQVTNIGGELNFKNECVNVSGVVNREYTRDREVKPATKYLIRFVLKNLN